MTCRGVLKGVWAFCCYLFIPQWGKHPKDAETMGPGY